MPELPLPLISLSGTPREIGGALGERTADAVRDTVARYRVAFREQGGVEDAVVARLSQGYRRLTREFHPRVGEALDALAEGAGVAVDDVYAINARTELMSAGTTPPVDGCTAVAALPTATADGHLLLGQNWDWAADLPDTTLLLATRDERGHEIVTLAEPGMLAKAGLNDAGLGLTVNILKTNADGNGDSVPYHVRLRAALESRTLAGAREAVQAGPCAGSINVILARGDEAVDLEVSPDGVAVLDAADGVLTHANHCVGPAASRDVGPETMPSTFARADRAARIVDKRRGELTLDDLRSVFRDHTDGIDAICRHAGADDRVPPGDKTVYSVAMDLTAGTFSVAAGPVCEHAYATVELSDVLPG